MVWWGMAHSSSFSILRHPIGLMRDKMRIENVEMKIIKWERERVRNDDKKEKKRERERERE